MLFSVLGQKIKKKKKTPRHVYFRLSYNIIKSKSRAYEKDVFLADFINISVSNCIFLKINIVHLFFLKWDYLFFFLEEEFSVMCHQYVTRIPQNPQQKRH